MTDRQVTLLYLVSALVLLALMAGQVQGSDGRSSLTHFLRRLTAPAVAAVTWTGGSAVDAWQGYVALRGAEEENAQLRRQVASLRAANARLQEFRRENLRLRDLVDLESSEPIRGAIGARVVSFITGGVLRRAALVDRGRAEGVGPGWIAMQGPAVVGRVVDAGTHQAEVILITDPDSGVAVRHQLERFSGVLSGGNRAPARLLPLEYVPRDKAVAVGDTLVTSGLDGIYPPGLLVGWIREIDDDSPLTWNILVEPAFDASRLEEVLLLPSQSADSGDQATDEGSTP